MLQLRPQRHRLIDGRQEQLAILDHPCRKAGLQVNLCSTASAEDAEVVSDYLSLLTVAR